MQKTMFKKWNIVLIVSFFVVLAGVFMLSNTTSDDSKSITTIPVAATIFPIYDVLRLLGGNTVDVTLLLPEGASLEDVKGMYDRDDLGDELAIFAVGRGIDDQDVPDELRGKLLLVDEFVEKNSYEGSAENPYYWLSIQQMIRIVDYVGEELITLNPTYADFYAENRDVYLDALSQLDQAVGTLLFDAPQRNLIMYGYDWGFFAHDYNLNIVYNASPYDESVSFAMVQNDIKNTVEDHGLASIVMDMYADPVPFLPLMSSRRFSLLNVDVLGGVEDRQSYIDLMLYNAETIFEALNL